MPRDLSQYLGQAVTVIIDRPLGSRHPRHPEIVYPINYGYLPGTVSGDGMAVDVYLLGVNEAVVTTDAIIIAIVVREDDAEDKLVAAPLGLTLTPEQIQDAVWFQERFFQSRVLTQP